MNQKSIILFLQLLISVTVFSQELPVNAIKANMLIFPTQPLHVHSSCIVNLPNGDLLTTWFEGTGERTANDVKIMGSRLAKNAKAWSKAFPLADTYNFPDCNPVLFLNRENKLFLVWVAVLANNWESSVLRVLSSSNYSGPGAPVWDGGDNIFLAPGTEFEKELQLKLKDLPPETRGWSAYAPSYDRLLQQAAKDPLKKTLGWMPRIAPLTLASGRILLPLYSDGFNFSLIAISDDQGKTWRPSLPVVGRGNVQPSLVQRKDGSIVAWMRDNGDEPNLVQVSESKDMGESWTAATKTNIPNTASVKALSLKNGKWAMVVNDITDGRYRIRLYLSDDEGRTWKWKYNLENAAKDKGSFSYPSMVQTGDGLVHITYSYRISDDNGASIKYLAINPEVLTNK